MDILNNLSEDLRKPVESFLRLYEPELEVEDFWENELWIRLGEDRQPEVSIVAGEIREGWIHVPKGFNCGKIVIGLPDGMLLGWIHYLSMQDLGDRYVAPLKALNKMPEKLEFVEECPHMAVYGGWYTEDGNWECFGCGRHMVFS